MKPSLGCSGSPRTGAGQKRLSQAAGPGGAPYIGGGAGAAGSATGGRAGAGG
ncbi:MAG: PE family protein, partial [Mycobacteriaceae bacterium]|nr:PE family protein [Mycobacteriaceae bacterium]